jgi:hypothetical protein
VNEVPALEDAGNVIRADSSHPPPKSADSPRSSARAAQIPHIELSSEGDETLLTDIVGGGGRA